MKPWIGLGMCVMFSVIVGCASSPPENYSEEKVKQNSEEGFRNLEREENKSP